MIMASKARGLRTLSRNYTLTTPHITQPTAPLVGRSRPAARVLRHKSGVGIYARMASSETTTTTARSHDASPKERSFPALFVRGGTSNGLVIHKRDLPPEDQWHKVLPEAMGSPDSYGRQLDGMGSGISSTSKVIVLSPPTRPDVDVEYTFVQVGIKDGSLDKAGNCGNMSAAVGPMSVNEGLVRLDDGAKLSRNDAGEAVASLRLFNTNTSKTILSQFRVGGDPPRYVPLGDYAMDGVPGTGSKITLKFLDPAGAKTGKALPTGNPVDVLTLEDGSSVSASLVDVSNPGVFVRARDLGLSDPEGLTPPVVEADARLKDKLEGIRRAGAAAMGLDPAVQSVPKVVMLFDEPGSPDADVRCLAMSMGQAHKAVPLTLGLCLGVSCYIPGTLGAQMRSELGRDGTAPSVVIRHPSGTVDIGTTKGPTGEIVSADLHRTSRVLMSGEVFY